MANSEFIGRRVSVGLGIEGTYGTEVAPAAWMRQMKLDFQRNTTTVQNESAMGRTEKVNDSAVVEEWAEGKLEGKVYDLTVGYLLYNMFGSRSTATNADASGSVKDHTFTVANSSVAPTLTVSRIDPISKRRHGMGTLETLDITCTQGDWVMLSAGIKAKAGVTSTDIAAYAVENSFTSKHVSVKLASNLAGLTGATSLAISDLKLNLKRDGTLYYPFGTIDPSAINTGAWEASGEFTLRYGDGTLEANWFTNAIQALQIAIKNTDVTIGTSANPGLVFTAPRVRLNTFTMSDDLDKVVEQTIGFYCELDTTQAYALQAVLTNTQVSY